MKAEQIIELIKSLEPAELERLFHLVEKYEIEMRRGEGSIRLGIDEKFAAMADQVFTENEQLFQKLADFEAKERSNK